MTPITTPSPAWHTPYNHAYAHAYAHAYPPAAAVGWQHADHAITAMRNKKRHRVIQLDEPDVNPISQSVQVEDVGEAMPMQAAAAVHVADGAAEALALADDADAAVQTRRLRYICQRCGEPKKGHWCKALYK